MLSCSYRGQRTANDFLEYIKAALSREAAFARIPELSALAQKLVETTAAAEQSTIVADAEKAVAKLEDDAKTNGELYLKYMAKVVAQGKEYVAKELARLQKLIAGGMSAAKQAEVSRKVSVLSSFEKGAADPSEEPEEPEPEEEAYGYGGYGGDFADGIDIDFGAEGIELDVPEDAGVE